MKPGNTVNIYQRPITEEIPNKCFNDNRTLLMEGKAKLIYLIKKGSDGLEYWRVQFTKGGYITTRWVKTIK